MTQQSQINGARTFGIELVGAVPWGTHLCQFYESKQDLIDILVPYFSEGLRSNEFCMWITSLPLEVEEATKALKEAVPDLEEYIKKGQIEIISYNDWYLLDGKFDSNRVLQGWVAKEKAALERGFDGLRLTGNTFWVERALWKSFVDYEEAVNSVIGGHRMIAVCTYCLTSCSGTDVLDVVRNHIGTLIKQGDKWYLVEDAARRKAANGALKLSEQRYSALFVNMQDGFVYHKVLFDETGKPIDYVFLEINEVFERLTGLKRDNVLGKTVTQVLPGIEKDPANWIDVYGKVALTGEPVKVESYAEPLHKWYLVSAYSPEKGYVAATFEDITEQKKFQDALVNAKAEWERTFDSAPDLIAILDTKHKIVRANRAMAKRLGTTPEQCIGLSCYECVHGTNGPPEFCPHTQTLQDGQEHVVEVYEDRLGGDFLVSTTPLMDGQGRMTGSVHVARDITERKKAEEILREQSLIISSASDAIFSTDNEFILKSWNRAAEQIFGWTAEEAIGKASTEIFSAVYPTLDGATREQALEQLMKGGFWKGEMIYHKKDGSPIPVSASSSLVKDENGNITGVVAVVHDITARKRREDALREVQRDLNRAQAVAKTGSWRLDMRANVLLWSDETYRMFGISKGTPLTYETFLGAVHPQDREYVDQKWQAALRGEPYDIEHRIIANGEIKWVREKAELEFDDDGVLKGGFGTVQDITESVKMREKLEDSRAQLEKYSSQMEQLANERAEKLKDAERLAAIGATAGMVGHDIRNPLQAIVGDLYLVKSDLALLPGGALKEGIKESLGEIEKNVEYIDKIVQDLQDYAKPLKPTAQETDFEELFQEVLFKNGVPENIEVSYQIEKKAKKLVTDPMLLKRILSNLTNNAVQAMPEGGKLEIHAHQDASEFVITVHDTGVGIPEEVKPQLFTPLFTTKSKGQGFGLAVVKRMTEALNGTVTFESEEGKGTKFIVRLPQKRRKSS